MRVRLLWPREVVLRRSGKTYLKARTGGRSRCCGEERRREKERSSSNKEEKRRGQALVGDQSLTTLKTSGAQVGVPLTPFPFSWYPPPEKPADTRKALRSHLSEPFPVNPGHRWPLRYFHWIPLKAENKARASPTNGEARRWWKILKLPSLEQRSSSTQPTSRPSSNWLMPVQDRPLPPLRCSRCCLQSRVKPCSITPSKSRKTAIKAVRKSPVSGSSIVAIAPRRYTGPSDPYTAGRVCYLFVLANCDREELPPQTDQISDQIRKLPKTRTWIAHRVPLAGRRTQRVTQTSIPTRLCLAFTCFNRPKTKWVSPLCCPTIFKFFKNIEDLKIRKGRTKTMKSKLSKDE